MGQILVVTSSYTGGDLNVVTAVALGLKDRDHDVYFLGDQAVVDVAWSLGIPATATVPEHDLRDHMTDVARASRKLDVGAGDFFLQQLLHWTDAVTPEVVEIIGRRKPDLVLATLGLVPLVDRAASEAGVPWGLVNGSFYIGPGAQPSLEDDFSPLIVPTMRYCCSAIEHASLAVHGTPALFNTQTDLPPGHMYVGPLSWEEARPVPSYLHDAGHDWALVTLSSMRQNDVYIGQAAIDALAHYPIRVVLTLGYGHRAEELSDIPANTRVERTVPHSAVLERSVLLVSPGGAGAVMKALQRGVPMVLVPWGMDRIGVAIRSERLQVARIVHTTDLTPEILSAAIDDVLTDNRYKEVVQGIARELQQHEPVTDACMHIERFLDCRS
jgi:UDP:flavonoid glycosyltransferase YjiC (YdhE family)